MVITPPSLPEIRATVDIALRSWGETMIWPRKGSKARLRVHVVDASHG